MYKLHSHLKPLTLTLLCITATAQCMEEPPKNNQLSPLTWSQTYHHLSKLLLPELMPLIFSQHCYASGIDYADLPALIKKSCESPLSFIQSIKTLLESGNDVFATEIFERGFAHTQVSICDIKDRDNWTVLHRASSCEYPNVVKIILHIAGDKTWKLLITKSHHGNTSLHYAGGSAEIVSLLLNAAGDNVWTLLATKDISGDTALHYAAFYDKPEMVKLLLNAAGHKAQELMAMPSRNGKTAFYKANPKTKEFMQQYLQTINKS
jgi:hypothetical protein